jgi:cytochrome c biogenesis protein CcdA
MGPRKICSSLIVILVLTVICSFVYAQKNLPKLTIFYSPTCHKCQELKTEVMPKIQNEFAGKIEIEYRDISDINNYKYLLGLRNKYRPDLAIEVPVFFMGIHLITGKGDVENNLKILIYAALADTKKEEKFPEVNLIAHFKSFRPATVISAGLIDGINPCAFTVIVFFISFLTLQGYRKRDLVIIGFSFVFTVFLTYLLIGLGIFNFFYSLKGFWATARIINISVGIFSIALGIFAVHDFFKFRKTKSTEGLILQLPQAVKNRIHTVIGMHYRKTAKEADGQHFFRLLVSTIITGFLVSILEAVCTGQVYLPTITFVLKTTQLKLQAFAYLLLYNLMFITPLLIIFLFALLGVTSEQFARFLKRHLGPIKILMAVLFFGLGIFLIWRA